MPFKVPVLRDPNALYERAKGAAVVLKYGERALIEHRVRPSEDAR